MYIGPFPTPPKKKPWPTWETHDWPVTPEYVLTLHCLSLPHLVVSLFLFVGGGVFCFLCMVVVDFTMSKYISPWHLSLLCSIYTLTRSQQSATESTNIGDLRLKVAHFSPPFGATAVGLTQRAPTAYPLWSKPRCTVWPHQLPS